jgi:cell division protein FtsL
MIRFLNVFLVMAVIALSILLYDIKYRAQAADRAADKMERQIAEEEDGIRVLRAEWSYLNQPERLQALATRYTELRPLAPAQIGAFSDVPVPHKADDFYAPGAKSLGGYAGVNPNSIGAPGSTLQ